MPFIDLSNIEIQKTIIAGSFSVLSTVIAAVTASLIGKNIADRRKLQEKLEAAISDIEFLLQVEKIHCDDNRNEHGESNKNRIRQEARNSGFSFSGKFTPGRVRSK